MNADYGTQGPEHFDRFGVRHHVRLETERGAREFMDANPRGPIKRLGLTLRCWSKRWPGMEVFHLDIWDRPLEIKSYSDGRISLYLDGQPVYVEKTKVVTEHGTKRREVTQWFDSALAVEEMEDERRKRLDAVRAKLEQKKVEQ